MAWKAASAGGGAPRSPLSPFPPTPTPPPASAEEQQPDEEAAALAISDRRTLYLVNIFIGSAARFLNSFAAVCEDKLADVHRRIVRVDSTLRLLEAKLGGTSSSGCKEAAFQGRQPEHAQQQYHHPFPSSTSSAPPPPADRLKTSSTDPPTGR